MMNEEKLTELLKDPYFRIAYGGMMKSTMLWLKSFVTVEQRVSFAKAIIFSIKKSIDVGS
jgi:hypothetical protein